MTDNMPNTPPPVSPVSTGPKWPVAIGIIGIVFGVGGIFNGLFQLVSLPMTKAQMATLVVDDEGQARLDKWASDLGALAIPSSIVMTLLGIILLIGAILLLKRKKPSVPMLKVWSIGKIIAGITFAILMRPIMKEQMAMTMPAGGGSGADSINNMVGIMMDVSFYLGFVWLCAFPVFLFIWFSRRKVKEDIANFS